VTTNGQPTETKLREYLRKVTADLHRTRTRLRAAEAELAAPTHEPVAIIGVGCRFPGDADSPADYWRLLDTATDAITPFPDDRGWPANLHHPDPAHPGTTYVDRGGFLTTATRFDAPFFATSPREAAATDPQQRLLLETTYHALDDAGLDTACLRGSDTGVYIGAIAQEYAPRLPDAPDTVAGHLLTGTTTSVASGRISYAFGFEGPTLTVDTACSSSLVAIHLAVRALRAGECALAVAGGVTVMAGPGVFTEFSRQRGLAPDGRCKPFSADADGTSWGEGAGVVVLEKLSTAVAKGRRILAVVRGSAVNSDGASNGLTAPNGPSQERVITAALHDAGLRPADVDVVEAHGTGTQLGDPIEAGALIATYGENRVTPLLLGSVKSNIGHTQAAAATASLIKLVLAFQHERLPPTINSTEPTHHVQWPQTLRLTTTHEPWPADPGRPRRAAVSSFGISGTNAHLVVEEPPAVSEEPRKPRPAVPVVLLVSAADETALRERAAQLITTVTSGADLGDVAAALAGRTRLPLLASVSGMDSAELVAGLRRLADGSASGGVRRDSASLAVQFAGQGGQRPGMGRELYETYPVFRAALDDAIDALDPHLDRPLRTVLFGDDPELLTATGYAQPAIFALETALYHLIHHWGTQPHHLVGHSIGEITAAHCAGILDLTDAAALITTRATLMQNLPPGAMLAVDATEDDVTDLGVDIAAVNGPGNLVLSGDHAAIHAAAEHLTGHGKRVTHLRVSHAFHSHHMDPILDRFRAIAATLTHHTPHTPVISTLTGRLLAPDDWADHWSRHLREPVRYSDGLAALRTRGVTAVLELGPDSTLTTLARQHELAAAALLRRTGREPATAIAAVTDVLAHGADVDRAAFAGHPGARHVDVPPYPFQRRHYWLDPGRGADLGAAGLAPAGHPLLAATVRLADRDGVVLTGRLAATRPSWLADHVIAGRTLLAGTAFLELAVHAADEVGCGRVDDLTIEAPLALTGTTPVTVQLSIGAPDDDGRRPLAVHARTGTDPDWVRHATGTVSPAGTDESTVDIETGDEVAVTGLYDRLAERGYRYGPAFRGLRAAGRNGADLTATAVLPDDVDGTGYGLHPALLDAVLHVLGAVDPADTSVPFTWHDVVLHASGARAVRARLTPAGPGRLRLVLTDADGRLVLTVGALLMRQAGDLDAHPPLHELTWVPVPTDAGGTTAAEIVHIEDTGVLPAATAALARITERLATTTTAPLVFVTRGAVQARPGEHVPAPAAAAVWGLVRTAEAEHPGRFRLVDIDPAGTGDAAAALATGAPQVAVRGTDLLVPTVTRAPAALRPPAEPAWRLTASERGGLDGLALTARDAAPLGPAEVRVAIRAAGLNFRDALLALGMYPGAGELGSEGAGVVVEVGAAVTGVAVGDRVMGLFTGCAGPLATTDHRLLAPAPAGWSWPQAATTPVVFLTAYYGLVDLARARPGETVLVHAATGGVGSAALQLARVLGLSVRTTAGLPKQHHLLALGVDPAHIADSRTTAYAATYGRVDIVLNSLAREHVDASLGLLADGGRFLEMGKTDLRDPARVAADHPGVAYLPFDLMDAGPDRIAGMFAELAGLIASGDVTPLPVTARDVRQAAEALRQLSQATHIGKLALTVPRRPRADGTVLITGGTGALGALVARHLVARHDVRRLVLVSRRGAAAPGAGALVADLTGLGAHVDVVSCDLTDSAAVRALVAEHPPTTVVHAAGVLDDVPVDAIDADRLATVVTAKADPAWLLHELTDDVDAFVLFSSAAGALGNPGQGSYAAANAALDALAAHRVAHGLPATAIGWGPWRNLGMAAGIRAGVLTPLPEDRAIAMLDAALDAGRPALLAIALDHQALRAAAHPPTALRGLAGHTRRAASAAASWRQAPATEDEQHAVLADMIRAHVTEVLALDPRHPEPGGQPLRDLGFDSLTSVELRNRLAASTGTRLSTTAVFDHPTVDELAVLLRTELGWTTDTGEPRAPATTARTGEPVAIVGAACRLPGGIDSPEAFWRLLTEGGTVLGPFPDDRGWDLDTLFHPDPDHTGTSYVDTGGFLTDAGAFDAEFFGIGPREATAIDPQQRLLLETSWEALERAGIDPASLRGGNAGVFAGVIAGDYKSRLGTLPAEYEGYLGVGNTGSVASGRVAYALGSHGPALTVDTACSSSLVAVHLAVKALRDGDCDLALAGGATVMASPGMHVEFSRQRGLAPDGRCKPFSADADGTAWSEGAVMLVLAPLATARANGYPVLGLVTASAVNSDGASNGLTAPNGPAQQRLIARAIGDAGLAPSDVDVVEAHGTGTSLGDPIEAQALLATYGQNRDRPLELGAAKANLGHTQAAAGAAGVLKLLLALRHGELPPTPNITEPTPHVDWSSGAVRLTTSATPWPRDPGRPRRAAISAFGISGTNGHVVIEEPPAIPDDRPVHDGPFGPLPLSARTERALRAQAGRLAAWLADHPGARPDDVARGLAARHRFDHRAVVLAGDHAAAVAALTALADGTPATDVVGTTRGGDGRTAFLFSGQGSQRTGMGADLYATEPAYAAAFDAVCAHLDRSLPVPLHRALCDQDLLDDTRYAQPALFAVEVALFRLLESRGFRPDQLIGHSVGELAAAHVAGVLDLADACTLVAARGELMAKAPAGGAMWSVEAAEDELDLAGAHGRVVVAAVNGPRAVVLSGDADAAEEVARTWERDGRRVRRLRVSHAFHSPHMDTVLDEFRAVAESLTYRPPALPVMSTVTGTADAPLDDPGHWVRHVRDTVRFADGVRGLAGLGVGRWVELGPDPVLLGMVSACLDDTEDAVFAPVLRRNRPERLTAATALACAPHADWSGYHPHGRLTELPTYPFDRQRHWLDVPVGQSRAAGVADGGHPLLTGLVDLAEDRLVLTGTVSARAPKWTADHVVAGATLLPGTAFVDLALHAARVTGLPELAELTLETPLRLTGAPAALQLSVEPEAADGTRALTVRSRTGDGGWLRHATGTLSGTSSGPGTATPDGLDRWPPRGAEPVPLAAHRDRLAAIGYDYGPAFLGLDTAWRGADGWYGEITLPIPDPGHVVHPALLDAALHLLVLGTDRDDAPVRLPFVWSGVTVHRPVPGRVRVRLRATGPGTVDVLLADETGRPVLTAGSAVVREARRDGGLYEPVWHPVPLADRADSSWDVLAVRSEPGADVPVEARRVAVRVLDLVQSALRSGRNLAVVTHRAIAATPDEDVLDVAAAPVWGLVRAAQAEHPGRFALVDVDEPAAVPPVSGQATIAVRDGIAYTPRLTRTGAAAAAAPDLTGATVLITGGTGALGGLVARHLVEHHGVRRLVLVSRSGGTVEGLDAEVEIEVVTADIADPDQVADLFAGQAIDAVVHAAGVLDDATVETMTGDRLHRVLAPKTDGAWHLHRATLGLPLRAFVLFSSAAGLLGNAGQANYAAGSTFLDALAAHRRANGLPALSLAWGPWTTGMAAGADRLGGGELTRMTARDALSLLDSALATNRGALAPLTPDLTAMRARAAAGLLSEPLRDLVPVPTEPEATARPAADRVTDRLAALRDPADRTALVAELVSGHVAGVLGMSPDQVRAGSAFSDIGFDSLAAVELRNRIAASTGVRLPSTAVFDFPTPAALTAELTALLAPSPDAELDAELDRLADRLAGLRGGTERGIAVRDRLHRLAASLDPGTGTGTGLGTGIDETSLETVFAFIDGELGRRTEGGARRDR
jgi:acyl transferase domain-containing protein/D-arabinose 1-dehydrogenase-like Zn-dependent alcohol dehydrogenase/acyl carrier protein